MIHRDIKKEELFLTPLLNLNQISLTTQASPIRGILTIMGIGLTKVTPHNFFFNLHIG
jgi:hypothetical protein